MKIAVLTSGGDAPGMNAAIRSVVRTSLYYGIEVYVVYDGYRGLVTSKFKKADRNLVSEILTRGGTVLGTARMTSFADKEIRTIAIDNLRKQGIDCLIVIGGDGTFRGAAALNDEGFPTIGIPASIDNDIGGTDYTIGFHTALQTVVENIDKLKDTSSSHQRASIVETMGRHNGDLALYAGLSTGAEFIITPEHPMNKEAIIEALKRHKIEGRRNAIIVITENILDVYDLAKEITEKSGFACRATVLGYVQRGGSPVPQDRILAGRMGAYAVELAKQKISGVAIGIQHEDIVHYPIKEAFLEKNKKTLKGLFELAPKIA
ncbi:MAG: 6-phosphofructokinase [Acholeplasmataceae bacterium]|jgi:6-phosphofructokinase 1|nr:6-phosphofructokinase [Acholeplasmataceae bacterium]